MASAAPTQSLPLLYNAIEPLNATQHSKMNVRAIDAMPQAGRTHAIPVTVDEFALIQRHYPRINSGEIPGMTPIYRTDRYVLVRVADRKPAAAAPVQQPAAASSTPTAAGG